MKVDLALVLAVDCSSSVDEGDFQMQMNGIAEALRNPALFQAIQAGDEQRIAISMVQWSTHLSQRLVVKWRVLEKKADLTRTADEIQNAERHWKLGGTGLAAAIDFSVALLGRSPFETPRKVIDISGDGEENDGGNVVASRGAALAQNITINGLPIIDGSRYIEAYYRGIVTGGPGSFVIPATNMQAFREAMKQKLLREIDPQYV